MKRIPPITIAWLGLLAAVGLALAAHAAEIDPSKLPPAAKTVIDFSRDIQPIFENSCWRCHGPERPKSHFRLDNRDSALKGGDNGVDILPGNSAASPLIHNVARLVPDLEMPPEGKGQHLTPDQIGLLRAWIDQGVLWNVTNAQPQFTLAAEPTLGGVTVDGNRYKFREIEGFREGMNGGLESFSLEERPDRDTRVTVTGRALLEDADFKVALTLEKTDLGFIRAGFEHWRRYYDDTGGYYRPFAPPAFDLGRDLHLDIGRAWIDFGLKRPHWPLIVLGYEYQFKEGTKSTLEWGSVNGKNIYPASEDVNEHTHIFKFNLSHDIGDWHLEDAARVEIYAADTRRLDVGAAGLAPPPDVLVKTREQFTHIQGMNTLRIERQIKDWWLISGGYLYSRLEGDFLLNQATTDAAGVPVTGGFWSADDVELKRQMHLFNIANQVMPVSGLVLSAGLQSQWQRQEGLGRLHLDEGDPDLPQLFLLQPATARSDIDSLKLTEDFGLRFTRIPYTVIFAEARLEQETLSQFEELAGQLSQAFLRDTDATNDRRDVRAGFSTSPWPWLALNTHYRNRFSDTDYDHFRRFAIEGDGYSAFIRHRRIDTDEFQTKLTLRPGKWLKIALTYRRTDADFFTATDPLSGNISPGGSLLAGVSRANLYGLNASLSPLKNLQLSTAFTYSDSVLTTARHGISSVVPYEGSLYSFIGSATYTVDQLTRLEAAYSFSTADYGQQNFDGLPLGLDFTRHGLLFGLTRRLTDALTANLRYRFYSYSEPTSGRINDYTAHGLFLTLAYRWK